MPSLPNGTYRTSAGSTVTISGTHSGIATVEFDWLEESHACVDCEVNPYPVDCGNGEWRLEWSCDYCDGGSAVLHPVKESEPKETDV